MKSLNEMKEVKRFQGSAFDEFSRRKFVEDRDPILEFTAKIQELQNEVNCMNVLSRSLGMPSRNDGPPRIWDTHGVSGNVFVNPPASSSSPCPGGFNPWISNVTEHMSPHVTSERQNPDSFGSEMPVRTVSQKFSRPQ